jgi:fructokinase
VPLAHQNPVFGGIEAGGTKFVCAIGDANSAALRARAEFATGDDPQALLSEVVSWFKDAALHHGALAALGVASFGPVDLDPRSPTHGFITTTPKRGWKNTDVLGPLRRAFPGAAIGFDTDVNGAALGEGRWGAARDLAESGSEDFVYITVGTGIGGGAVVGGKLLHGLVHPEMGHVPMPVLDSDRFEGACAFHGRCWEGLCGGPAIAKRAGRPAQELAADDPAWDLTARYMAHALVTLTYVLSPRRIIVGGSVRKAGQLGEAAFFERLRRHFRAANAGYIASPALHAGAIDRFIVPPALGDDSGVCGAIVLAQHAWRMREA